jgi:hypothetical protein
VAIDASAMNEIERMSADVVENFIESKSLEHWSGQAQAIPDFRFVIPNRRASALP